MAAGLRSPGDADLYFAIRLLGPLAALDRRQLHPNEHDVLDDRTAAVAFLAPDLVLTEMIRQSPGKNPPGHARCHRSSGDLRRSGLGLDQALLRSGQELALSHPADRRGIYPDQSGTARGKSANRGLAQHGRSHQAGCDSRLSPRCWRRPIASAPPSSKALTTFSDGMRMKRRQQAEEMAAKTTVKLVFPLVLFIFPSIFIVLLGPAMITIMQSLSNGFQVSLLISQFE